MARVIIETDLDLCRDILLRTEHLWDNNKGKSPAAYKFEGHHVRNVQHNIRLLGDARLIVARLPKESVGRELQYWPTGLTLTGWEFLAAIKDESVWQQTKEKAGEVALKELVKIVLPDRA